MKIVRMYSGGDNRSHLEEIPLALKPSRLGGSTPEIESVRGRPYMAVNTSATPDFHPAPRRQYLVVVEGKIDAIVGDGSRMTLVAGDILFADDLVGEGHIVRMNGCDRWVAFIVPLGE